MPQQTKDRSTAIIFVTTLFLPRADKLVPSGVAPSSLVDFFCSGQAKGLEVTCRGRYDDNLSVRHITGNHLVVPEKSEFLNIRTKSNSLPRMPSHFLAARRKQRIRPQTHSNASAARHVPKMISYQISYTHIYIHIMYDTHPRIIYGGLVVLKP